MRWKKPKDEDVRCVKRFALFPIELNNEVVWLENVYIKQRYVWNSWCGLQGWVDENFISEKDYELAKSIEGVVNK